MSLEPPGLGGIPVPVTPPGISEQQTIWQFVSLSVSLIVGTVFLLAGVPLAAAVLGAFLCPLSYWLYLSSILDRRTAGARLLFAHLQFMFGLLLGLAGAYSYTLNSFG